MPSLAIILAAILEAVGLTSSVLGIVQVIRGILLGDQLNKDLVTAEEQIALMYGILTNGTYGLPAIEAEIAALTPIALPTTPPPGYGTDLNTSNVGASVWLYPIDSGVNAKSGLLYSYDRLLNIQANTTIPWQYNVLFYLSGPYHLSSSDFGPSYQPVVKVDSILPGDTVLSWLTREEPSQDWTYDYPGWDSVGARVSESSGIYIWQCIYTTADFDAVKKTLFGKSISTPAWPGLANVTLGTPVALSPSLAISTAMDGVLVQALTPSAPKPTTNFGGVSNYRAVGGLAFVNDDGEAETIQALGFTNQVYVPLTMVTAAGVIFKCDTTVDATVTPWSLA